jgi:pimeloyl-ACP methyl ester carboxylesterase
VEATLAPAVRRVAVRGIELSIREWSGTKRPFLLVHGLASNARTWDGVAARLQATGHYIVAVDQRGHGLSDKPDSGYDFDETTADLKALIENLGLERPLMAGQSYGGQVVLDVAARWPELAAGLVLVDGGFIELATAPGATWEQTAIDLKPPHLIGTPRDAMVERVRTYHPDWPAAAVEMQMGNFETREDGTIAPWLTLDRHMQILAAIWDQRPSELYAHVSASTLIAAADGHGRDGHIERKRFEVAAAEAGLEQVRVRWFEDTAHDIQV